MGRTGLYTQFGFGEEVAWGTDVAPTRFLPIVDEDLSDSFERITSESLMAGIKVDDYWAENRKGVEGGVTFEVFNKGFGLLLKHIFGAIASAQPSVGPDPTVWEHTATLGGLDGKSLSVQVGVPDVAGTVNPFTVPGAKVVEWELSLEVDGLLRLAVTFDGIKFLTATSVPARALGVASYATGMKPLPFHGATLDIGGTALKVRSFSLSGSNGLKVDRFVIGQMEKLEQIEDTERRSYESEIGHDFDPAMGGGMAAYNAFVNGTEAAFNAKFLGDIISTTKRYGLELTMPRVRRDGATPTVGGPDVVEQTQNLKILQPAAGASPITAVYRTTDASP